MKPSRLRRSARRTEVRNDQHSSNEGDTQNGHTVGEQNVSSNLETTASSDHCHCKYICNDSKNSQENSLTIPQFTATANAAVHSTEFKDDNASSNDTTKDDKSSVDQTSAKLSR